MVRNENSVVYIRFLAILVLRHVCRLKIELKWFTLGYSSIGQKMIIIKK